MNSPKDANYRKQNGAEKAIYPEAPPRDTKTLPVSDRRAWTLQRTQQLSDSGPISEGPFQRFFRVEFPSPPLGASRTELERLCCEGRAEDSDLLTCPPCSHLSEPAAGVEQSPLGTREAEGTLRSRRAAAEHRRHACLLVVRMELCCAGPEAGASGKGSKPAVPPRDPHQQPLAGGTI